MLLHYVHEVLKRRNWQSSILLQQLDQVCVEVEPVPGVLIYVLIVELGRAEVQIKFGGAADGEDGGLLTTEAVRSSLDEWVHLTSLHIDQVE